jgi:hypothetical protein
MTHSVECVNTHGGKMLPIFAAKTEPKSGYLMRGIFTYRLPIEFGFGGVILNVRKK